MIFFMGGICVFDLVNGDVQNAECSLFRKSGSLISFPRGEYWKQHLHIDAVRQTLAAVSLEGKLGKKALEEFLAVLSEFESLYDEYFFASLIEQVNVKPNRKEKAAPPFEPSQVLDVLRRLLEEGEVTMSHAEYFSFVKSAKTFFNEMPAKDAFARLESIQRQIVSSLRKQA